jgi:hypothetical protein
MNFWKAKPISDMEEKPRKVPPYYDHPTLIQVEDTIAWFKETWV